jgi:hypothetical protein
MATMNFDQVWEAVKALSPEEQSRLRSLLDRLLARQDSPLTKDEQLDLLLLKEGVLSQVPNSPTSEELARFQNWKPIELAGKPLSETIVEERR